MSDNEKVWETFCDIAYFDLWRVRRKSERGFHDGFHLQNSEEANGLVEILNKLEKDRTEALEALREISAADWKTSGELRGMARLALYGEK